MICLGLTYRNGVQFWLNPIALLHCLKIELAARERKRLQPIPLAHDIEPSLVIRALPNDRRPRDVAHRSLPFLDQIGGIGAIRLSGKAGGGGRRKWSWFISR